MSKNVQHETVTTWTCDRCGGQDIVAVSAPSSRNAIPEGWLVALFMDGGDPSVAYSTESGRNSYGNPGWDIQSENVTGVAKQLWCGPCCKSLRVSIERKVHGHDARDCWLTRLFGHLKFMGK